MSDHLAAQLRGIAGDIDQALQDEHADRQLVAETASARIRYLATVAVGEAAFERRQPRTIAAATSWVGPDGTATLTHEDLLLVIGALRVAVDVADPADMAVRYEMAALAYRLGGDS